MLVDWGKFAWRSAMLHASSITVPIGSPQVARNSAIARAVRKAALRGGVDQAERMAAEVGKHEAE